MEIGCSGATISYWETGGRLPNGCNLSRIMAVLVQYGASTAEVLALRRLWRSEAVMQKARGRIASCERASLQDAKVFAISIE
jgi:hypothetical protein